LDVRAIGKKSGYQEEVECMKVIVDRDLCEGIGNCVAIAPGVFELDEENKVVATHIDSVSEEKIREAAESCPLEAIILQDDEGDQIYP
jgi:ferredoxin